MKRSGNSVLRVLAGAWIVIALASAAHADVLPFGLKIEKVLDNTVELGDLAQSPNGELWLLERTTGTIRVYVAGVLQTTLTIPVVSTGEGGLLDVAFAPDYATSGRAFVYYVDSTTVRARVNQVNRVGTGLQLGGMILDIGAVSGGANPGGGLDVGPDGKLYVGVGDLGFAGDAQNDAKLSGKTLRANLDGSVPSDNASGTLVWAKGFRNGKDLVINPTTARTNGTLYLADRGTGTSVYDEINAVRSSANYGWSSGSGPGFGETPLVNAYNIVPEALEALRGSALGTNADGSLVYACVQSDDLRQAFLTGAEKDQVSSTRVFFDPDSDRDGTPDAGCPKQFNALARGRDGWLYGTNIGANPGVWRIWNDTPGPREVSAPGSPFILTVDKDGANVKIGWEKLGALDTGRPARNAGQHATRYQVWEGQLPIAGSGAYTHTVVLDTDGTADGTARLVASIPPGSGDRYYLVNAQGDNKEGSLGSQRPAPADYCDTIGWGKNVGQCAQKWTNPTNGAELKLKDLNPNSPTYGQLIGLGDYRGKVVRLDLSAYDCFWCDVQADFVHPLDVKYRDRDTIFVTVFMKSYTNWSAYPNEAECATGISAWAAANGETSPILCDVDLNADGKADAAWQWYVPGPTCGGTPHNFYIDQGHVVYKFVCGAELSSATIEGAIAAEANAESCE